MALTLRTDPRCLRLLTAMMTEMVELRKWWRPANRRREQMWPYSQFLDAALAFALALWKRLPNPGTRRG